MNFRLNERSAGAIGAGLVLLHGAAVLGVLGTPGRLPLIHQVAGLAASVVAIAGTVLAARAFGAGDYLRRVWTLFAVSAVLLFAASAMRVGWMLAVPELPFEQSALAPVRTLMVVVLNLLNTGALVLLALTYRRSGLQPPRSWRTHGLWALCTGVALAIVLPQLRQDLQALANGGDVTTTLAHVVSALGDLVTIVLVAPILRVAYMMRGGRLAWTWWAMAAAGAMWIVYDAYRWDSAQGALALLAVARTAAISLKGVSGLLQCAALEREPAAQQTGAALRSAA
jgi:hypothetical protein